MIRVLFVFSIFLSVILQADNILVEDVLSKAGQICRAEYEDIQSWRYCVRELKQPSINEMTEACALASAEFMVPEQLLRAIAAVETNWVQIGPSVNGGFGICNLLENDNCDHLGKAAEILGVEREKLRNDWKTSLRGTAAILAFYAGEKRAVTAVSDWFEASVKYTGLPEKDLAESLAMRYFEAMDRGYESDNLFGVRVKVDQVKDLDLKKILKKYHENNRLKTAVVTVATAFVRKGPGKDFAEVCSVKQGSKLKVHEEKNDWYRVTTPKNNTGWISGKCVSVSGEDDTVTPHPVDPDDSDNGNNDDSDNGETPAPGTDYPGVKSRITKVNYQSGRAHDIDTFVIHFIGVGTYEGSISWFHNKKAQVSAHFVIRSTDGEITQVVRVKDTAWHCGGSSSNGVHNNSRSIGVEHEATIGHPEMWTSKMMKASAKMAAFFAKKHGIPGSKSCPGIQGHKDMPQASTDCPGEFPWDTFWRNYKQQ